MFTIFQNPNTVNTFYDFSVESSGASEKEKETNSKKEQQETSKFILNNDNTGNPNFSEWQKRDIKKIQEMYKDGGLTEHGAIDMVIKLLWQGQSLEQQYAPMNKISADMERANQASKWARLAMQNDQESAGEMLSMAFGEKLPKPQPENPQPTTSPGEYPSMPPYSTSPIEPTPVPSSPSPIVSTPTTPPGNNNF